MIGAGLIANFGVQTLGRDVLIYFKASEATLPFLQNLQILYLLQASEVFITSTVFLWFADFFGPYRQKIVMQEALSKIMQIVREGNSSDEQIDTIRKRYERIRLDSVSEY
jgi:hypothetical protein